MLGITVNCPHNLKGEVMKAWILGFFLGSIAMTIVIFIPTSILFLGGMLIVVSFMDWSGQGDGREGCNRHTVCDH